MSDAPASARYPRSAVLRRPVVACLVLAAVYLALSFLNDERGYLGTDTGGKVATLRVMEERGRLDPDVGYWAERWDPKLDLHPLYYTYDRGGKALNVSTLPALLAAYPLWRFGGYRATLLLPMLGSLFAALAARALVRRLGASAEVAWSAFWIVGLASPLAVYALDFWEHSIGVALTGWGIVLLLGVLDDRRPRWSALGAGVLFGVSGSMRTDTLVYGAVATAVVCTILLVRRAGLARAVLTGAVVVAGLAIPLVANEAMERAVLGDSLRSSRASATAENAISGGGSSRAVPSRVSEAHVTLLHLQPTLNSSAAMLGAVLVALAGYALWRSREQSGQRLAAIAALAMVALYLARASEGLGFVPGLLAASPIAIAGLVRGWTIRPARPLLAIAVLALPVVFAFQYRGGAVPQWGGRYLLVSGLLLAAAGAVVLADARRWLRIGAIALAASVTAFGVGWLSDRSHAIAETFEALDDRDQPLVSTIAHLFREGGAFYTPEKRWLTAIDEDDLESATGVLAEAGESEFGLVQLGDVADSPVIGGWRETGEDRVPFFGGTLRVTTYERTT
jgi:hypothetical protein